MKNIPVLFTHNTGSHYGSVEQNDPIKGPVVRESSPIDADEKSPDSTSPGGIKKIEAAALVWTMKWLITAYILYVVLFSTYVVLLTDSKHIPDLLPQFVSATSLQWCCCIRDK